MVRVGISLCLLGFGLIALLLATSHTGAASHAATYLFFLTLVIVVAGLLANETKKR